MNEHEHTLIACLDALDAGEPLDAVLERYPQDAANLRPILETAALLPTLRIDPEPYAAAAARQRFLAKAQSSNRSTRSTQQTWVPRLRVVSVAVAVMLALLIGMIALVGQALPGDPLYNVKRTAERVQLAFAPNDAPMRDAMRHERREEILALIAANREATVDFDWRIVAINGDTWIIGGLPVQVTPQTRIVGNAAIGQHVDVLGRVHNGAYVADLITVTPDAGYDP